MRRLSTAIVLSIAAAGWLRAQSAAQSLDWPYWGGDAAQTKYSRASDITPANVQQLELAWSWSTVDRAMPAYDLRPGAFAVTPIVIDNVLYASTSFHRVVAMDADTGRQLWLFDPKTYEEGPPMIGTGLTNRGVAYWRGEGNNRRILIAGRQRLFSVDAATGKPDPHFGDNGTASLTAGLGNRFPPRQTYVTSAPVVYKQFVMVGSMVPDRIAHRGAPPGLIQAFDITTGKRVWSFYTIPQSATDAGAETWGHDAWKDFGGANAWAPMALDEARGLLYVATSTPAGDYWGGTRLGANLFAESIVCLDAATGKRRWHFQAVHHGLWDYDFGSPPNLVTITVDGKRIDAVAQVSKQGFTYVLDRTNGRPVWPIEERPVDTASEIPGEQPSPTQPFPTKPPPLVPQGVSLDDANDLTPEIKELAVEQLQRFKLGPLFTLPTFRGTVQRPGQTGAANWGGAAFDPETGMLYVRAMNSYHVSQVCKNDGEDPLVDAEYGNYCGQHGLFADRGPNSGPPHLRPLETAPERIGLGIAYSSGKLAGLPLIKPPYAYIVAIDLNKGDIAWRVPFGDLGPAVREHPLLKGVTLPPRLGSTVTVGAGAMVTKSGLVFVGGGEPFLYAFDKATGREVWRVPTPFRTSGNPITYKSRGGRQFVVIATGAGPEGTLAAFALGGGQRTTTLNPAPESRKALSGANGYTTVCGPCHGPEGRGALAPNLVPMKMDANQLAGIVREGRGYMPPVSTTELTDAELEAVVAYLRTVK